jgi:nitrate reductase delta subunit
MLTYSRKSPECAQVLDRVREWVRGRFGLADHSTVMVAEIACTVPGCPPVETVIAFWSDERRYHLKIFKPVLEVVEDDLPPGWLRPAFAVPDEFDCTCC